MLVFAVLGLLGAAKRRRRRRRLFVPRVAASHALVALASNDLSLTAFPSALDQECWAVSMDVVATLHSLTANEGPIIIGVAHGDYSAAEIEEWFEAGASWVKGDKVSNEHAARKCRMIGTFAQASSVAGTEYTMNNGNPKRVKLGFLIEDGQTLSLWAYNEGTATLTTGAIVEIKGKIYLSPR